MIELKKNYKAVILDLDNTLYSYEPNHQKAIQEIENYCSTIFNLKTEEFKKEFKAARRDTHFNLGNTASSHNRILYFQRLTEKLEIKPMSHSLEMYSLYWDTFFKGMKLRKGVLEALMRWKNAGLKICVLTDLTTHLQFRKIQELALEKYLDCIVTSEEVGQEKPHPYAFHKALLKLQCTPGETIVIGDNWNKDIMGAVNVGMDAIWFTKEESDLSEIDNHQVFKTDSFEKIKLTGNE